MASEAFEGFGRGRAHLITSTAAGLQPLSVVSATEDLSVLVEIDEVHQQLLTHVAHKALGMPALPMAGPGRKHYDFPSVDLATALYKI